MLHVLLVLVVTVTCTPRQLSWAGGISSACIVVGAALSPPSYLPHWILLINRATVIGIIGSIVYYSRTRAAAEAEVKTLRGILPICAACKRIRTDDGAWQQIEVYIRDHSAAEFSHGLCAECMTKLYPDYRADSGA
jgi:hypothetical protein